MIVACRVFLSLVLFALLLSYGGRAAGGTLLLDLSGENWSIAPDPQNAGRGLEWWKGPTPDAKPARVPGIIQTVLPGYHGVAWYWRDFDAPANPYSQGRWLLRFGAVDYLAEVWVNGVSVGGHEGGETPFTLDITDAVKPGAANHLAVRVLNPTAEPIDGIVLAETPHRNKAPANITVGGMYNEGGITEPVELLWCPAVRIEDVFVRPDWKTGHVRIQATVQNNTEAQAAASICFAAGPARSGLVVADTERQVDLNPGDTIVEADLDVPDHQLWNVDNPYLYRLDTRLSQETIPAQDLHSVRFGFRDFRVEKGYFRLNG
ncbi:MAG TPA: glycoside hydrolase family 2, partial [Candidatus Bathyarchaeia archaeon]|nr:glycoside hydrolase family 2 [Candidatus Bathyarchaeia archaeon]